MLRKSLFLFLLAASPFVTIVLSPTVTPPVRANTPLRVEVTILSASASDDIDPEPFKGAGECYLESTATTTAGSTALRWPISGTANCDDHADFFNNNGQTFTLYPNFIILPEQVISGGVSFHVEAWEEDLGRGHFLDPDDTFGRIDFLLSDSALAAMNGCSVRSDTTTGGEKPMTITSYICVTPIPPPPPSCSTQNGIPPLIRSTYTPMTPAAGLNFTVTATATATSDNFCGITYIRITALGTALASPQTKFCDYGGELFPPQQTCVGNFGSVSDGGYVIYQVRASDLSRQVTYEPPIIFDAGNPRTNDGWPAPTLGWGTHVQKQGMREVGTNDRKDAVFFAEQDYGINRATFIGDVQNAVYNGVFQQAALSDVGPYSVNANGNSVLVSNQSGVSYWVQQSNRYRFNFWFVWDDTISRRPDVTQGTCGNPSGPCVNMPSIPGCGLFEPCNWGFADTKGVFHTASLGRDASAMYITSCWCYTAQSGDPSIVLHEMGHNLWGLGDEYCCDAPYGSDSPHKNVWGSLSECQSEAAVSVPVTWSDAGCEDIGDPGHHFRSNPGTDVMRWGCFGCGGTFQAASTNRMEYVHRRMPDPVPSSSFQTISGVSQMSNVRFGTSQSSTGVCVSDPLPQSQAIEVCFPTGVTEPSEMSKIIVVVVDAYANGTIRVVGTYAVYGAAPDLRSDLEDHARLATRTKDGEHLEFFGLPNTMADQETGTPTTNLGVPIIFGFRGESYNLTITFANGTLILTANVEPAVQDFCAAHPADPACIPPAGSPTPTIAPPSIVPLVTVLAPTLLLIAMVRILRERPTRTRIQVFLASPDH